MGPLRGWLVAALLLGIGTARPAAAQFSPGRLSRSHSALEGSAGCLQCHEAKRGAAAEKCLACHVRLAARMRAGRGLHARPDHQDCKTCHVEHQGVEADLVWWGKAGRNGFDHGRTGHVLEGRHQALACESCHARQATPTFLGLSTACVSCHADRHRGTTFAGRDCRSCHSQQAWRPAAGFDHARTSYPLTGRHGSAACTRCHVLQTGGARTDAVRRAGTDVRQCSACHTDAHEGRLGPSCAVCHTTSGWSGGPATARFDHASTGYVLAGRHAAVPCRSCHRPGRPRRPARAACTDCHADTHQGQLADARGGSRCEGCHDVSGFRPSRFTVERHQAGRFPLQGAHLAVACNACHRPMPSPAVAAARALPARASSPAARFRFASTACRDCHADPHRGEMERHAAKGGCEACHGVESWRATFDHARTAFPLVAQHAGAPCRSCHTSLAKGGGRVSFAGLTTGCASCHRDPHQGQFARAGSASSCESCHQSSDLKAARFDHRRDSAFPLEGAHAKAPCASCHPSERQGDVAFVRYRPTATACKACHAGAPQRSAG
jgi:hypothetical protein